MELFRIGDASTDDEAAIIHWISEHCDPPLSTIWSSGLGPVHAMTLLLAHRHKLSVEQAFEYQIRDTDKQQRHKQEVDVDLEAIQLLEDNIFAQTHLAGKAGLQQWGLDIGVHQDRWKPYGLVNTWQDRGTEERLNKAMVWFMQSELTRC